MTQYRRRDYKGRYTRGNSKKPPGLELVSRRSLSKKENIAFYGSIILVAVTILSGIVIPGILLGIILFFVFGYISKQEESKANALGIYPLYKSKTGLIRLTHFNTWVAGVDYNELNQVSEKISKDTILTLKREPDNKYDPNAIGVWFETTQIGHLPKEIALSFYKQFDRGDIFTATVTSYHKNLSAYDRLRIVLIDETYQQQIGMSIIRSA